MTTQSQPSISPLAPSKTTPTAAPFGTPPYLLTPTASTEHPNVSNLTTRISQSHISIFRVAGETRRHRTILPVRKICLAWVRESSLVDRRDRRIKDWTGRKSMEGNVSG